MWRNTYKDYKPDQDLVQEKLESGKGMVGCEMHELNGWGERRHFLPKPKKGLLRRLIHMFFYKKSN